jgi:hypothetical protein
LETNMLYLRKSRFITSSENPAQLFDVHENLIGFRFPVPVSLIETLERTEHMLPERKPIDNGRGFFAQRNYVASGDFWTEVSHSRECLDNEALWKYLTALL